ncbi:MAG: hypothetical protein ABSB83_06790 [Methanomassiliicoccales archaeon]|jgi:hypothetical protein
MNRVAIITLVTILLVLPSSGRLFSVPIIGFDSEDLKAPENVYLNIWDEPPTLPFP